MSFGCVENSFTIREQSVHCWEGLLSSRKSRSFGMALLLVMFGISQLSDAAAPVGDAFVYKVIGDRQLSLYISKPDDWRAGDSRPAIVFYHGGG